MTSSLAADQPYLAPHPDPESPDHRDPFSSSTASHHGRFSQFDNQLFALGPTASPDQAKRALEAHLAETERRIQDASKLGTTLVQQRKDLADRLKDVEMQQGEADITPELRQKLLEVEKEYNEVGRESARAFLQKPRVSSAEAAGGSPFAGDKRSVSPSKFESQATGSPTKLSVPNRKQRNQPSNRVHDIEFATEISTSLLSQVRHLQALLSEKEESLKTVTLEKSRLEIEAEGFHQRLRSLDESEHRYKDENWNLETQIHEYLASAKAAADREKKLNHNLSLLQAEKSAAQKELDDIKLSHAKLSEEHASAIKHHEAELGSVKRSMTLADNERGALQRKVEELTGQNQELARAFAHQRGRLDDREHNRGLTDEDFETAPDNVTPEHSPPPSPTKGTPRHSMLESETLKSSLHHAHRMIQNLKGNIHREKTEKLELKRMLQDARDELDARRGEFGSANGKRSRKVDSREFKKPKLPGHLGGSRSSKSEILMTDPDWEEDDSQKSPSHAASRAATGTSGFAGSGNDSSDVFETAAEQDSTDDFETANERGTETEGFQTGVEDMSDDSTETQGPGDSARSRPTPVALTMAGNRNSFQSTASGSGDEYSYEEVKTPVAQPQRLRLRVGRGTHRRSRTVSDVPSFKDGSPASFLSSSRDGTPQVAGQSLFAELGDLSDEEDSMQGTPSRSSYASQTATPLSRRSSRKPVLGDAPILLPSIPPVPRLPMVDSETMTDAWEPAPATSITSAPLIVGGLTGAALTGAALSEAAHLAAPTDGFPDSDAASAMGDNHVLTVPELKRLFMDNHTSTDPEPIRVMIDSHTSPEPIVLRIMSDNHTSTDPEPVRVMVDSHTSPEPIVVRIMSDNHTSTDPEPVRVMIDSHTSPEPIVVRIMSDNHTSTDPEPVRVMIDNHTSPEPIVVRIMNDNHTSPEPELVRIMSDNYTSTDPEPVRVVGDYTSTEPVLARIKSDNYTSNEPEVVRIMNDNHTSTEPEVVRIMSDNHTSMEPILVKIMNDNHTSTEPEVVRIMSDNHTSMEPILVKIMSDNHTSTEPEVVRIMSDNHTSMEPILVKIMNDNHTSTDPEPVRVMCDGFTATDTPVKVIMLDAASQWVEEQSDTNTRTVLAIVRGDQSRPISDSTFSTRSSQYESEAMEENLAKFPPPPESRSQTPKAGLDISGAVVTPLESTEAPPSMPPAAPKPGPLAFSSINFVDTEPTSPRSPWRNAIIIPRDDLDGEAQTAMEQPQTPSGAFGGFGRNRNTVPITPVIAEDDTRQSPRDSPKMGTPDSQRPLKEVSGNPHEHTAKKVVRAENIDESSQTALTSEQIDALQRHKDDASSASSRGTVIPAALRIRKSQDSLGSGGRAKLKPTDADVFYDPALTKRSGSAGSVRNNSISSIHPPLPMDHKQVIAAAARRSGSSSGGAGSMGPSLLPNSTQRSGSSSGGIGSMGPPPVPATASKNPSFRPATPSSKPPLSPSSLRTNGTTPRPIYSSAGTIEVHSPPRTGKSRASSISSFASEIDSRFNIGAGLPHGIEPGTDPRMINAITQTMIGEYLWKYTRKAGRGVMSENRHRRYFWVHPYTRTLYWSDRDPSAAGRAELKAKSVPIEAVRVVTDDNPMPPGLHRKSLVIMTPGRAVKFTATTGQRHETWFNALSYLLLRTEENAVVDTASVANGALSQDEVDEFNPAYGSRSTRHGAASLSSYNSRTTHNDSPAAKTTIAPQPHLATSTSSHPSGGTLNRLSNYWKSGDAAKTFSSRRSRYSSRPAVENAGFYEASEVHDSAEDLREHYEKQDRESDRLENVRACCDGKHDVGHLHSHSGRGRHSSAMVGTSPSATPRNNTTKSRHSTLRKTD